jgi:hypothetical protein
MTGRRYLDELIENAEASPARKQEYIAELEGLGVPEDAPETRLHTRGPNYKRAQRHLVAGFSTRLANLARTT